MKLSLSSLLTTKRETLGLPPTEARRGLPRGSGKVHPKVDFRNMLERGQKRDPVELMDHETESRQGKIWDAVKRHQITIAPQAGKQQMFASCSADICIYGGAAGGGKSYGLILEDLPHIHLPDFASVTFRRTFKQIRLPGGLWDKATALYRQLGAKCNSSQYECVWPSGARSTFSHMEHESDMYDWQGGQVALIKFDELTHFTESQFWYLTSRNRSTCGIKPYVRATTNPEPGSWVGILLDWWIGEDGFAIEERCGVIRWFVRLGNEMIWDESREALLARKPDEVDAQDWEPISITFISAALSDNPALTTADPKYRSTLAALPLYERMVLLFGNWKVRPGKGMRFRREWFQIVDQLPDVVDLKRYWDRAGTEPGPQNKDPDWTAGVKGGKGPGDILYVTDVRFFQKTAALVEDEIRKVAKADYSHLGECELWLEQDPAQAGKVEAHHLATNLEEFSPHFCAATKNRYVRSGPASSAAENGRIKLLRGPWNERFLNEVDSFVDERVVDLPPGYHDDITTAFVGWYERMMLSDGNGPRIY